MSDFFDRLCAHSDRAMIGWLEAATLLVPFSEAAGALPSFSTLADLTIVTTGAVAAKTVLTRPAGKFSQSILNSVLYNGLCQDLDYSAERAIYAFMLSGVAVRLALSGDTRSAIFGGALGALSGIFSGGWFLDTLNTRRCLAQLDHTP